MFIIVLTNLYAFRLLNCWATGLQVDGFKDYCSRAKRTIVMYMTQHSIVRTTVQSQGQWHLTMCWCLFAAANATPGSNQGHSSSTACLQVPISGNDGVLIKFLFLSAFFRDIKYFCASKMVMWTFKCGLMNLLLGAGNWKFEKCLRPIGSGFRDWARVLCIQRIAYYAGRLFPPLDPDHHNVW